MTILVIAEHDNAALKGSTLNTVAAASKIGGDIHVLVAGAGCGAVADAAKQIAGVAKVKVADNAIYKDLLPENLAELVKSIAGEYDAILAPATPFGKEVAPRVAALLDVAQISSIIKVEAADTFVRSIYSGAALATVKSADAKKVITVATTAFDAAATGGSAAVENVNAAADLGVSKLVSRDLAAGSDFPALAGAKIVCSGGRGVGSADNYVKIMHPLAKKLGGALGASRAAVDAGYVPDATYQVGQTGTTVAPQLYIAVGISGAIQHLAGMKDSKVIVAINKDPEAPIAGIADYFLEADLNEAVPALVAAL